MHQNRFFRLLVPMLTMIVPAVWKRNGLKSLFCTTKFGRIATGGTSTTIATFMLDYNIEAKENEICASSAIFSVCWTYTETVQVFFCVDHLQLLFRDLARFQNVFLSLYHSCLCEFTDHKTSRKSRGKQGTKQNTQVGLAVQAIRPARRPRTLEVVENLAPLAAVEGMESLQTHEPDVVVAGVDDGPLARLQRSFLVDSRRAGLGFRHGGLIAFLLTLPSSHNATITPNPLSPVAVLFSCETTPDYKSRPHFLRMRFVLEIIAQHKNGSKTCIYIKKMRLYSTEVVNFCTGLGEY